MKPIHAGERNLLIPGRAEARRECRPESAEDGVHQRTGGKLVIVTEQRMSIPSYAETGMESMPMFAENRVHQRTSGRPYPNCVGLKTERQNRGDKEYTVIQLENEYKNYL